MPTAPAVVRSRFKWHTRATWRGFGVDMPRFLHESPPSAPVVNVHAAVFAVWLLLLTAQILLVVGDRVTLHRGWDGLWRAGPVYGCPRGMDGDGCKSAG